MRPFFFASLVIVAVSLLFAARLDAKGGKGGGGGHGRGGGGHGNGSHGSGGPKWSRQQSHPGGGQTVPGQQPVQSDKPQFAKQPNSTTDAFNQKQKQLDIEQRNRDKRMAQAQHLRQIGQRNGNQNLIDNADRMEAFAHDHYARRVSQLEKFGVTDPTVNPGSGLVDPLLPGTPGVVDPLGNVGVLPALPFLP